MKKALFGLVALVVSFLLAPVAGHAYTPTITSTSTISPTHSITPTKTITPNGTLTATPTFSVSPTITQTRTRTPSVTPTLTATLTSTPTPAYADPDLTSPGSGTAGKVMGGADTKLALSMVYTYGLADCGASGSASAASHTAQAVNLTTTTGMRPSLAAALPYFGTWTIYVLNTGASSGVAAVRMKSAGVVNEAAGGKLIKAGEGVELHAIARDGLHLWLQGVTQTTTLTYSICVN